MQDILLGILDAKLDYGTLGALILLYIVALWAAFSFWVLTDAKRRYKSTISGIVWFLLVFILNFPALIFYIIIRPEHEEGQQHGEISHGGLNVPVANFIGNNEEVEFTLSIKLNPKSIKSDSIKFTIEGHPDIEAKMSTVSETVKDTDRKTKLPAKLSLKTKDLKGKISALMKDFKSYSDKIEKLEEVKQNDTKNKASENKAE